MVLFNNGIIIAWLSNDGLHDISNLALPISFSNSSYVVNGPLWIDQIVGITVTRTVSSMSLTCVARHCWFPGGMTIIGY